MGILDFFLPSSGKGGAELFGQATSIQTGMNIGAGIAGLAAPYFQRKVAAERDKTRTLIADINAKRVARSLRYQQGLARVGNAAAGNSEYGDFLFVEADNARAAAERVNDEYLRAQLGGQDERASIQTFGSAAFDLVGALGGAYGNSLKRSTELMRE